MTFTDSVKTCLGTKLLTIRGRATRSEYWWFQLFVIMFCVVLWLIGSMIGVGEFLYDDRDFGDLSVAQITFVVSALLIVLVLFVAGTTVSFRRFHDVNISGWWCLALIVLSAITIYGIFADIALLVVALFRGTDGPNNYGEPEDASFAPNTA